MSEFKNSIELRVTINSDAESIWSVLTDTVEFTQCFSNLEIACNDWKTGEKIYFKVVNTNHVDEAIITKIIENRILSYNYFKSNYITFQAISFIITAVKENKSELMFSARNFRSKEEYLHSQIAWDSMLKQLMYYLEKNTRR